jgi:hypothetical protein
MAEFKNLYETSNEIRILFLPSKLTNLKMAELDSVIEHVQKLQKLKNELLAIDTKINDTKFIAILFYSLPDLYQNSVTSFCIFSQHELPTFEDTVGFLIQGEQRLKKNESEGQNTAFAVRHRRIG